jgi:hypothetical protein
LQPCTCSCCHQRTCGKQGQTPHAYACMAHLEHAPSSQHVPVLHCMKTSRCCCRMNVVGAILVRTMDVYALPRHHSASVRSGSIDRACSSLAMACRRRNTTRRRQSINVAFLKTTRPGISCPGVHCCLLDASKQVMCAAVIASNCCQFLLQLLFPWHCVERTGLPARLVSCPAVRCSCCHSHLRCTCLHRTPA